MLLSTISENASSAHKRCVDPPLLEMFVGEIRFEFYQIVGQSFKICHVRNSIYYVKLFISFDSQNFRAINNFFQNF